MRRIQIYVMAHEGAWTIRCEGRYFGSFPAPVHALHVAIAAAMRAGPEVDAHVMVQGTNSLFRTEWMTRGDLEDEDVRRFG